MEQSRIESFLEVCTNIGSGMIISYFLWKFVLIDAIERGYLQLTDSFTITLIFTIVSVIRSYFWRRFFASRTHKIIHNFFIKGKYPWLNKLIDLTKVKRS